VLKLLELYGESFMRLEKEHSTKEFAFFLPLTEVEFINRLLSCIRSGAPSSARAFDVLVAYAKLGGLLSRVVVNNIAVLGEAVLHLEASNCVTHDKLTFTRWGLVNVLSMLAVNHEHSKQTLDSISIQLWCALSSWFLKYHLSSLYQQQFFQLVNVAVNVQHEKSLHNLFVTGNFLTKMIEFYKSSTPGSKAYTHLIANLLKEGIVKFEGVAGLQEKPFSPAHQPQHAKTGSGNEKKKGKGGNGTKGKGKAGKACKRSENTISNEAPPTIPFFKYLSVEPTWSKFIEGFINEEIEQQKKNLPIILDIPTSMLEAFLS